MVQSIPMVGIANAGKTSLIRTFQREFKALAKLKPTKGIERTKISFLDEEIIVWDFGGQDKFRKKYLNKADAYFSDLDQLFFVIDFQDQTIFKDVINYFNMIRTALMEYSPNVVLYLILNKFDPGMENDPEMVKLIHAVREKFTSMAAPLTVKVFETSIFNPLSVIHAMSKAVLGNTVLANNLEIILSDFVKKNSYEDQIELMLIYTPEIIELGSYFRPDLDQLALKTATKDLFEAFQPKKLKIHNAEFSIEAEHIELVAHRIQGDESEFYILTGYKPENVYNVNELKDNIRALLDHIEKILLFI